MQQGPLTSALDKNPGLKVPQARIRRLRLGQRKKRLFAVLEHLLKLRYVLVRLFNLLWQHLVGPQRRQSTNP